MIDTKTTDVEIIPEYGIDSVIAFSGIITEPENLLSPEPTRPFDSTCPVPDGCIVEPLPTVIVVPTGSVPLVIWLADTIVPAGIEVTHCGKPVGLIDNIEPFGPAGSSVARFDALPYHIAPALKLGKALVTQLKLPFWSEIRKFTPLGGGVAGKCNEYEELSGL